ncbi:DNA repair protein XRCC3 [Plodia interpunctella]|uniref:DNA repair protein XRCC3 n=1 Tax=Plodia interpunctella TaxID=58824 RepID=UPI002368B7EF|nr:DNA repair protein XRCC3 [Plodia interpunctella]
MYTMPTLKDLLPSKLHDVLERANICTIKEISILSINEMRKFTNLCNEDILLIKNIVCHHFCPKIITSDLLETDVRITTGCDALNDILKGGYRRGTITEVYGESGCGKTQLAMQSALNNWQKGSVLICTEDLFPVKRFEQLKKGLLTYNPDIDYGENIFVEHVTEAQDLLSCIRVRLPKLLTKHKPALIVIDSIAAPFRVEITNYIQRAEELREVAVTLLKIAKIFDLAILCINQVSASFNENVELLPSLGLAWSNMISTRIWIKKTTSCIDVRTITCDNTVKSKGEVYIREAHVMFAPDVPNSLIKFVITELGIIAI